MLFFISIYLTADVDKSIEEKDLAAKLARLNSELPRANEDLAAVTRITKETEFTAITATLVAEEARRDANRIRKEIELKTHLELEQQEQQRKRMEEVRRLREEEERKIERQRQKKEIEWCQRESIDKGPTYWQQWPVNIYEINQSKHDFSLGCVIRGHPKKFDPSTIQCHAVKQIKETLTYGPQEELVSFIIKISSKDDITTFKDPLFVAIPHFTSRANTITREVIIKAKKGNCWSEMPTTEVTIDTYKDVKFAQTLLKFPALLAVVTRLKRDYVTLSRKPAKVTSSYDHRITMTVARNTFLQREHLLLEVQPVDSASVTELRTHMVSMKGLLSSSPILHTDWESISFERPIVITLPCPPNPAKAKKLAAMRALREERARNPRRTLLQDAERERKEQERKVKQKAAEDKQNQVSSDQEQQTQQQQQQIRDEESPVSSDVKRPPQQRWYMGIYGNNDDDENDSLYFVAFITGKKWAVVKDIPITQAKLDLLLMELPRPYSKFMVLRTRLRVDEIMATQMAVEIENYLSKRLVQVITRQRIDNILEVTTHLVPVNKTPRTMRKLTELGFEDGPDNTSVFSIHEGDEVEISFRGNLRSKSNEPIRFIFNSNMQSSAHFSVIEIDKYLQKNFTVYRGFLQLFRRNVLSPDVKKKSKIEEDETDANIEVEPQIKLELLTEILLTVSKNHIEPNPVPIRARVIIRNREDPVNENLMHHLAVELGDEWRRLSHYLNISRVRLQAIWRNAQTSDRMEEQARYEMLITWLKKVPKAMDKISILSAALSRCGRPDLTADLRMRNLVFQQQKETKKQIELEETFC